MPFTYRELPKPPAKAKIERAKFRDGPRRLLPYGDLLDYRGVTGIPDSYADKDMLGHFNLPGWPSFEKGDVIDLSTSSEQQIRDFIKKNVTCDDPGAFVFFPKGEPHITDSYPYREQGIFFQNYLEELRRDLTSKGYLKSNEPFIDLTPGKAPPCFAHTT